MNWKIGQILAQIWILLKMYLTWEEWFGEKNWIEAIKLSNSRRYYIHIVEFSEKNDKMYWKQYEFIK